MASGQVFFWSAALVGHGAFWVEAVNRLHGLGWPRRLIDAATLGCGLAVAGVPVVAAWLLATGAAPDWLVGYAWFCLAVLVGVVVSRALLRWDPQRDARSRLTSAETLDLQQTLGPQATGNDQVRRLAHLPGNRLLQVRVERRDVPLERLPPELAGLRVAHLTDLHMSARLSVDYFREAVRVVNEWSPDLVCLTGDLVEHPPQLDWVGPVFGPIEARLGAFFCLGNHDAKVDSDDLRRRLIEAGITDAGRGFAVVGPEGAPVTVCGDERPWFPAGHDLRGDEPFVVRLAHTPDRFAAARADGVDLLLAGHNHGGQVCFPLLGPLLCPSRHGVRYAAGTFRSGRTVMHVGRGTGSLFPLRYNCPPEVALLTLTAG